MKSISKQGIILGGGHIGKYIYEKRTIKINTGTNVQYLPGMLGRRRSCKSDYSTARNESVGPGCHPQESPGGISGSIVAQRNQRAQKIHRTVGGLPKTVKRTSGHKRRTVCRRARVLIAKKKSELGLKGPLVGHFAREIKTTVITAINDAMKSGMTQKHSCTIFGIVPRKFRRWIAPKTTTLRVAWNKILPSEKDAILHSAWKQELFGKPVSHIFVYGHNSDKFHVSLPTCYRVLNSEHLVRKIVRRRKNSSYISAHSLLKEGFSLLCYDATRFVTDTNIAVWALPVLLLPCRFLLHIGYSLNGVSAADLIKSVDTAYLQIPENVLPSLVAHSDRGSAMKSGRTRQHLKNRLGIPVHFGRPHTPDDEPWIEAFNRTLKYHRDCPNYFPLVDDVVQWFKRFPDIYNNDPHSSLSYVTPSQTLRGLKEVILARRKFNLIKARNLRLLNYKNAISKNLTSDAMVATIVIDTPT